VQRALTQDWCTSTQHFPPDVEVKVVGMLASESTEGVDGGCDVGLGVNIPSASYVNDLKVAVVHFCLLVLAVLWQK